MIILFYCALYFHFYTLSDVEKKSAFVFYTSLNYVEIWNLLGNYIYLLHVFFIWSDITDCKTAGRQVVTGGYFFFFLMGGLWLGDTCCFSGFGRSKRKYFKCYLFNCIETPTSQVVSTVIKVELTFLVFMKRTHWEQWNLHVARMEYACKNVYFRNLHNYKHKQH